MRGIRIDDGTSHDPTVALPAGEVGGLNFDLADVLEALGEKAIRSMWRADDLWCFGDSYAEIMALSEASTAIPGAQLLSIAERLTQVIDGEFCGSVPGCNEPWIVVKAIDSSWWEVWTDDVAALASLRERFHAVSEIHGPAV